LRSAWRSAKLAARGSDVDMTASPDRRLQEMGLVLPTPAAPVANYVGSLRTGSLLLVSGQLCFGLDGKLVATGKVGGGVSPDTARDAARWAAINVLAQIQAGLGTLDRVARIVRLGGFIACVPDFTGHPAIMNGASDLMVEVFGDAGRHVRTTVGVPSLPLDAPVEVEAMVEVS
jgi:enamine deaminase RidA (YjgF/YER057c/UK114 family)